MAEMNICRMLRLREKIRNGQLVWQTGPLPIELLMFSLDRYEYEGECVFTDWWACVDSEIREMQENNWAEDAKDIDRTAVRPTLHLLDYLEELWNKRPCRSDA